MKPVAVGTYNESFGFDAHNDRSEFHVALILFDVVGSSFHFLLNISELSSNSLVAFFDCSLENWFPFGIFNDTVSILQEIFFGEISIFDEFQFFEKSLRDFL